EAAGAAAVVDAVSKVRRWFGIVLLLGGLRCLARAAAWRLCLERPATLPLSSAFVAVAAGNAIGSVTPLGLLASEPSKGLVLSDRSCAPDAAAALVLENLCYVVSVLVAISIGGALLWVALGHSVQPMLIVAAAGLGALAAFGLGAAFLASRWHARAVVDRFQTVRRRIATIAVLETAFHV